MSVAPISDVSQVLTVAGNLIDNAIDAAAQAPAAAVGGADHRRRRARPADPRARLGPGVPHDMREAIFTDGVTTKSSVTGARRGLGLALVRQVVEGRGGMISVGHDGGAVFTAVLPAASAWTREPAGTRRGRCAAGADGGACPP